MSTKRKSQKAEIRKYLERNDHITAWIAMGVFKIMRLASRIDELRNDLIDEGDVMRVHSEVVRDVKGTKYVRYRLVGRSSELYFDTAGCFVVEAVLAA